MYDQPMSVEAINTASPITHMLSYFSQIKTNRTTCMRSRQWSLVVGNDNCKAARSEEASVPGITADTPFLTRLMSLPETGRGTPSSSAFLATLKACRRGIKRNQNQSGRGIKDTFVSKSQQSKYCPK